MPVAASFSAKHYVSKALKCGVCRQEPALWFLLGYIQQCHTPRPLFNKHMVGGLRRSLQTRTGARCTSLVLPERPGIATKLECSMLLRSSILLRFESEAWGNDRKNKQATLHIERCQGRQVHGEAEVLNRQGSGVSTEADNDIKQSVVLMPEYPI